jgi:hypothetical protein
MTIDQVSSSCVISEFHSGSNFGPLTTVTEILLNIPHFLQTLGLLKSTEWYFRHKYILNCAADKTSKLAS